MKRGLWILLAVLVFGVFGTVGAYGKEAGKHKAATPIQVSLLNAVRKGNLQEVKALLTKGADINAKDEEKRPAQYDGDDNNDGLGRTPLHYAVLYVSTKMAELLIEKGANVNATDDFGGTPLHYAADRGAAESDEERRALLDVATLLIAKGANVNAKMNERSSFDGVTPLHVAVQRDAKEFVELLLAKGADVNAKDKSGKTPLSYALGKNTMEFLLAHGATR